MYQVIIVIHVLLGLGIIGLIMIQQGKGADAGAAFGTGSSGSVFGSQGAGSFLSRTTAIFAALFFTTSLGLAILNGHKGDAYDFMTDQPAMQKPAIPEVDANKAIEVLPIVPDVKPEQVPSVPAVVDNDQIKAPVVNEEADTAKSAGEAVKDTTKK